MRFGANLKLRQANVHARAQAKVAWACARVCRDLVMPLVHHRAGRAAAFCNRLVSNVGYKYGNPMMQTTRLGEGRTSGEILGSF